MKRKITDDDYYNIFVLGVMVAIVVLSIYCSIVGLLEG